MAIGHLTVTNNYWEIMTRSEVLEKIRLTLEEILDRDDLSLTEPTTAASVDGWDSINHVKLIIALEGDLGVRFSSSEVEKLMTVGDLVDLIVKKFAKD